MPIIKIKVAGEGLVAAAHRLADPGPTSGSSVIYEIVNVPEGKSVDDVIPLFRAMYKTLPANQYEVEFADLSA